MAVEDVQQLIDLLELSPAVTELSISSASGSKVTIKRALAALAAPQTPLMVQSDDEYFENVTAAERASAPVTITATMVGLFHEANPPMAIGSNIVKGQIVGYIESMRLMNEVVSTVEGVVDVIIISESQPVEYGQPLFALAAG